MILYRNYLTERIDFDEQLYEKKIVETVNRITHDPKNNDDYLTVTADTDVLHKDTTRLTELTVTDHMLYSQFMEPFYVTESQHISDETDAAIDSIYKRCLMKFTSKIYDTDQYTGQLLFTGWNFNEYNIAGQRFYFTGNEPDASHHSLFIRIVDSEEPFRMQTMPRTPDVKSVKQNYVKFIWDALEDLEIQIQKSFIDAAARSDSTERQAKKELHATLAHEITHLYRSVIARDDNQLMSRKNSLYHTYRTDSTRLPSDIRNTLEHRLYLFDANELDARIKQIQKMIQIKLRDADEHDKFLTDIHEVLEKFMQIDSVTMKPDKTMLISAVLKTYDIARISRLMLMYSFIKELKRWSQNGRW